MSEPPICLSTRLRRAARRAGRDYDAALEPVGLGVAQYALLRAIGRLGAPTLSALGEATDLDVSTLGRNLRVLERREFLVLEAGRDKRTRVVQLTQTGEAAIARAQPRWRAVQDDLEHRLADLGGRAALFRMLDALEDAEDAR